MKAVIYFLLYFYILILQVVAQNGVPAVEIARVLQDGSMPAELIAALEAQVEPALSKPLDGNDVDSFCKLYDNIKLKANIPEETIEFIDKKLIQVRCSLEDVADNMVGTKLAMGAKEAQVTRDLCETLRKTGASAEITCTTMHGALKKVVTKNDCDIMKDVGRAVVEDGNYPSKCDFINGFIYFQMLDIYHTHGNLRTHIRLVYFQPKMSPRR